MFSLLGNATGSALVGAVAFAIVLLVAGFGYLQIIASASNNEIESLRDDKAFVAAESGLMMAAQWLFQQSGLPADTVTSSLNTDEILVTTKIFPISATQAEIRALAVTSKLPYTKQIRWTVTLGTIPAGSYGVYLDNAYILGGNTDGMRKSDYDGPIHSNTAIQLGNTGGGNVTHFNDRVTVHNIDPATNLPVFDASHGFGHYGNDYRYGVEASGGPTPWDAIFQSTYNPNASEIRADLNTSDSTNITVNANDSTVTFGVYGGIPYYEYRNTSNVLTQVLYDADTDLKLHVVNKGVAVSGTVKGRVTVYTDAGKDIYIPGNIVYEDFSLSSFSSTDTAGNRGYSVASTNVMGLFSGGNFVVANGLHNVTAQLFAVEDSTSTMRFVVDKNSTTFNLFGSFAVSGFWDPKQGNDQALFNQLWDRRRIAAPGLGYYRVDETGQPLNYLTYSNWNEVNIAGN